MIAKKKTRFKAPPADAQTGSRPSGRREKRATLPQEKERGDEENDEDSEEIAAEEKRKKELSMWRNTNTK